MPCKTTTAMWLGVSTNICASGSASRSGNTVTVSGTYSVSQGNSWNKNAIYACVDGRTGWTRVKPYYNGGGSWSTNFSFNFQDSSAGSATYTAWFAVYNDAESSSVGAWDKVEFSVSWPSASTPPTGLGANNIVRGVENFTANVYISSWGSGGTSAGRYRELQCWTYDPNNLTQPRRYQPVYGDSLSGNITVSNSSSYSQAYGPLNITGNTLYTLGLYASNGASAVGSQRLGDYTTLAYAPVLTLDSINGSTLTINYTTRADGGRYEKTYEYSIDGGTTWTTFATLSTGAASSGSFTTTGYTPGTPYVIKSRVTTQSGTTNANDLTIYEPPKNKFYGPVNGEATNAYKMYGSVNGQTKEIKKLYGSVNGESIRIF